MHRNCFFRSFILFCLILSVFGCASILNQQKGPNTFNTEPSGAEVYNENNIKLGTTPIDLSNIPKNTKGFKVRMDGFQESEIGIRSMDRNDILFVDAMLLCIPCLFDLSGKDIYSFKPKNATVRLRKIIKERKNAIKIAIDKLYIENKNELPLKINERSVKLSDKFLSRVFGEIDEEDEIIKEILMKSFFDVTYLNRVDNLKLAMDRPKILIKPVVESISFDLNGKSLIDYTGHESIKINWNIYKMSEKSTLLTTIKTKTETFRISGSSTKILDHLISEASMDLLENDSIYDYLQKVEKEYMVSTKGEEIKINIQTATKYLTTKDALKNSKSAVVTVINKDGFGSGFIISTDGYVMTNYHVIKDEKNVSVRLNNDFKVKATVVKSNKDYDLALLHIDGEDLNALPMGNSDLIEVGEEVYAIGTPMDESFGQTITKGIISGQRLINGINFLQTDVSINSGNSGGPLLNEKGEVIGITTMKLSGEGVEGIGFCIPSNAAFEMLNIKH